VAQSRHYAGIFLEELRKPRKTSFMIADILAEIPTEHLHNKSQEHYRYNPLGAWNKGVPRTCMLVGTCVCVPYFKTRGQTFMILCMELMAMEVIVCPQVVVQHKPY
jgi:hypothetical protein